MRITKQRAAENRERVVKEAARLFRERGFDGVGVGELMAAAGLTHGGF
jgi:TetR/AcrR family transcriptional regulator, transcriptional repressor for nem operon